MAAREAAAKETVILAAAKQLFGHYGYRRTSIDDIAQEARIAKGTVYLYFKSKEEIFRALCQQLLDTVLSAAEEAVRTPAPIVTFGKTTVRSPIAVPSPTATNAAIDTSRPSVASGATAAMGCTPGGGRHGGANNPTARANAR